MSLSKPSSSISLFILFLLEKTSTKNVLLTFKMVASIPFNAIALTLIYTVFSILVISLAPKCILLGENEGSNNKCEAEGVQKYVILSTNLFFIAVATAIFATHLYRTTIERAISATTFSLVSTAFTLNGFSTFFFGGNSGITDGKAMSGHYITTLLSTLCLAFSALLFHFVFQQAWNIMEDNEKTCGIMPAKISLFLIGITSVVILVGSLWTITYPSDFIVDEELDEYPEDYSQKTQWMHLVFIAKLVFTACYSILVISGASIFGGLARIDDVVIWGLRTSLAVCGLVVAQLVIIGSVVFYGLQNLKDDETLGNPDVNIIVYVVFKYAMVMTFYLLHNLVFALFPSKEEAKAATDTDDSDESSEEEKD